MRSIFSSATLKEDKARGWQQFVSDVFVPVDIQIARTDGPVFVGEFVRTSLASLDIIQMATDSESASRTKHHIAHDSDPYYMFILNGSGDIHLSQYDRDCHLPAAHFTMLDSAAPYHFHHDKRVHALNLKIPKALLEARIAGGERFCAWARPVEQGLGKIVSGLLHSLVTDASAMDRTAAAVVEDSVLELLSTLLIQRGKADSIEGSVGWATRRRCLSYARSHLADPALSPEMLARAIGISVRYLHKIFEPSGQTFGEYLLAERLDRAREALSRPDCAHLSIKQIAFGHGFRNQSHFSTSFRRRFGFSPIEARRSAIN